MNLNDGVMMRAAGLMQDDYFKFGGYLYRVISTTLSNVECVTVDARPIYGNPLRLISITMTPETEIKVYNQLK